MPNWSGIAEGYNNYQDVQRKHAMQDLQLQSMAKMLEDSRLQTAREQQARQQFGQTLQSMVPPQGGAPMGPPPVNQPPQMGMPQQGAPGPAMGAPPPPQGGMAPRPPMPQQTPAPGQASVPMAPPGTAPKPPIPPYQTVAGAAPQQQMSPQGIGAPPPITPPAKNDGGYQPITVQGFLSTLKAQGVPADQWMGQLELAKPLFDMQGNELIKQLKVEQDARAAAQMAYKDAMEGKRLDQGDRRLDALERGLNIRQENADRAGAPKPKVSVIRDENGMRYTQTVNPDGSITMKDAKGREVDPEDVRPAGAPSQETMRNAVKLDITELDYALDKIKGLGSKTASPWFADQQQPGAMKRWAQNDLTPVEMQRYDVFANRIAPAIASLQTMGRGQISDAKVRAAAKLIPQPGDDDATVNDKLTAIKALRDRANAVQKGKSPDTIKEENSAGASASFTTEAEAEAAAKAGKLKKGDRITVGGVAGTWQ